MAIADIVLPSLMYCYQLYVLALVLLLVLLLLLALALGGWWGARNLELAASLKGGWCDWKWGQGWREWGLNIFLEGVYACLPEVKGF